MTPRVSLAAILIATRTLVREKLDLDGFRLVMQDPRFCGIPMILETPSVDEDIYAKEIELLNSFIK